MPVLYPKYRHSASSANLWRNCQSAFIWRYGLQRWGKDSPRTWMGKASEAAVANALLNKLTPEQAQEDAIMRFYGLSEGEDTEHAGYSGACARAFLEALPECDFGGLVQHGPWRPVHMGFDREVSLKPDFIFERALVDMKATLALPSEAKPDHIRQVSSYALEWGLPGAILYVKPKKSKGEVVGWEHRLFPISGEQALDAMSGVKRDWRQIDAWDRHFASVTDAASVCPLNIDTFYWDDAEKSEAEQFWNAASVIEENLNGTNGN